MTPKQQKIDEVIAEFDKFFPEMCSAYKLKNVPRGVYSDIKSILRSSLASYGSFIEGETINKIKDYASQLHAKDDLEGYETCYKLIDILQNKETKHEERN